ncbi:MAG: hypothetical protein R3A44_21235 [Caldilineaceae bacterium]
MFAYSIETHKLTPDAVYWSQHALSAVAPGVLTPFSFSVLAEIARRSWYNYYDRLGFEPHPGRRLLRQYNGRAYLNLSVSAQIEAERAGVEPLTLWFNDLPTPLATRPKSGLLAAFKTNRSQKRIATLLTELSNELAQIEQRARAWYTKTQELRWTQAEILQVMEEIERVGADSLMVFLAARHNLMLLYNRTYQMLRAHSGHTASWTQTDALLGQADALHELDMARQVEEMAAMLRSTRQADPALAEWFQAGQWADWRQTLPAGALKGALTTFFDQHGRRCALEGELAHPRWQEGPTPVLQAVRLCAGRDAMDMASKVAAQPAPTSNQLGAAAQKQSAQWEQEAATLHALQSRALSVFSYIQAGTRTWALAAAKEAMSDGRLTGIEQVFYFELEEIKQMMTGEWNISSLAEIHATAAARKAQHQAWCDVAANPLLVGDAEAVPESSFAPAPDVDGVICLDQTRALSVPEVVAAPCFIQLDQLSTGDAIWLPLADGFLLNSETPFDPSTIAARRCGRQLYLGSA